MKNKTIQQLQQELLQERKRRVSAEFCLNLVSCAYKEKLS